MFGFWVLLLLFIALILFAPYWPYSRRWGHWPGGFLIAALLVWLLLIWFGFIVFSWPWMVANPPPPPP